MTRADVAWVARREAVVGLAAGALLGAEVWVWIGAVVVAGACPADAAFELFSVVTALCAALMSDWNAPRPCEPLPPLLDELGLSATVHSAKNATVATSSAISGRGRLAIVPVLVGRSGRRHERV